MFLIRPKPIADESLSSWRQRSGLENGFHFYPTQSIRGWIQDPDFLPSESEVAWLESEFGVDSEALSSLSLNTFIGRVFSETPHGKSARWVLALGGPSRTALTGPSFCPACLGAGSYPHYRLSWRFAFLTHCPIHHCRLEDRCPRCAALVWPAILRRRAQAGPAWFQFGHCPFCQQKLAETDVIEDMAASLSDSHWTAALSGVSPLPQASDALQFFDGLWAMCQLLLRHGGTSLWKHVPSTYRKDAVSTIELKVSTVEQLPIKARITILATATWLLDEWPERFVSTARACKLSAAHFSGRYEQLPEWFDIVVKQHLAQRTRGITSEQVQTAISACARDDGAVSKSAVRRWLGVAESKAIDRVLGQRRRASREECCRLVSAFGQALALSRVARDERATLARDFLIMLLSMLGGEQVESICTLDRTAIDNRMKNLANSTGGYHPEIQALVIRAEELQQFYAREVRWRFTDAAQRGNPWFVSRFGVPLHAHHLRQRVSKLMGNEFDVRLWKSADCFAGSLSVAPS